MIIGQVTSTPEAIIRFPVRDASGQEQEVEAVTGRRWRVAERHPCGLSAPDGR